MTRAEARDSMLSLLDAFSARVRAGEIAALALALAVVTTDGSASGDFAGRACVGDMLIANACLASQIVGALDDDMPTPKGSA